MNQKNILITGANGQLGNCLRDLAEGYKDRYCFFFTDVEELDITDEAAIESFVVDNRIDIIVNAAAYTAVDKAEEEVETAFRINRDAVALLAAAAKRHGCHLVHISTDYVFSGEACHPYPVDAPIAPKSVYGRTKAESERAIRESGCDATIIRTSWLYSEYGHNFVKTMMKLGDEREEVNVVCDQVGGPTYAGDLAAVILRVLEANMGKKGLTVYHYANEGTASWFDFATAIMEMAGKSCRVNAIFSSQYPAKATRPAYSIFDLSLIKREIGISIPYWRKSLELTINKLQTNKKN
ncbi:MAG: dTDP-4-dehydrorhamnose reductase [Bacteroidales bacterium]|nr:dTDP-4-dehydrorhamnose reductase [Bacteroidales bacterium]